MVLYPTSAIDTPLEYQVESNWTRPGVGLTQNERWKTNAFAGLCHETPPLPRILRNMAPILVAYNKVGPEQPRLSKGRRYVMTQETTFDIEMI